MIESKHRATPEEVIADSQDTKRYKECESRLKGNDEKEVVLSLNANVDGAEMLKSSVRSLWPLEFIINELPLISRFKNVIGPAVWFPSEEPNPLSMNLYLKYFIQTLKKLSTKGITVVNRTGEAITFLFFVVLVCR